MPAVETSDLNQKAVLWPADGFDNYGEPTVGTAVEINVRWVTGKRGVLDPRGNNIAYDCLAVVDRVIAVGSAMWLGELANYTSGETKLSVVDYHETPDIKGREFRKVVLLSRLSDELPESA